MMNLANRITLFRLALVPVILTCIYLYDTEHVWLRHLASFLYLTAALSDLLDGYIARQFDQKTRLGAILDPAADKILVNLSFVFLAVTNEFETQVPMWLPVLVLGRDATISVGSYLMDKFFGPLKPQPRILGKVTTVFQSAAIIGVLIEVFFAYQLLMAMVVISVVSLIDYFYKGLEKANEEAA